MAEKSKQEKQDELVAEQWKKGTSETTNISTLTEAKKGMDHTAEGRASSVQGASQGRVLEERQGKHGFAQQGQVGWPGMSPEGDRTKAFQKTYGLDEEQNKEEEEKKEELDNAENEAAAEVAAEEEAQNQNQHRP